MQAGQALPWHGRGQGFPPDCRAAARRAWQVLFGPPIKIFKRSIIKAGF